MNKIFIQIPHSDILNFQVERVAKHLEVLREHIVVFADTVHLFFNGYDYDPREIYEIPELVKFVVELDRLAPYLPILLHKEEVDGHNQFSTYLTMMIPTRKVVQVDKRVLIEMDPIATKEFLKSKLSYIGSFLDIEDIPRAEANKLFKSITDAFDKIFIGE